MGAISQYTNPSVPLQKWLSEAEQRGEVKGEATRGERQMLIKLLSRKFGTLPSAVMDSLSAITDLGRLEQLMDAAIDASSLDDFCAHLN